MGLIKMKIAAYSCYCTKNNEDKYIDYDLLMIGAADVVYGALGCNVDISCYMRQGFAQSNY